MNASWIFGTARRAITPGHAVQLAGCGYYLDRVWETVRDGLAATAAVIGDPTGRYVALVSLDLMYNDAAFTREIRARVVAAIPELQPDAICINCSHSHNAPTAGWLRGAGDPDPAYLAEVTSQAAAAIVDAFRVRQPVSLRTGSLELSGLTFNRTRAGGPVDTVLRVLYAETPAGRPTALLLNYHAHPILYTDSDFLAVSRDCVGEIIDRLEAALPGGTCMYLQGACGDVEFLRDYRTGGRQLEPVRLIVDGALEALHRSRLIEPSGVSSASRSIVLPTRRWSRKEIADYAGEGRYRLTTGDTRGWLTGIAAQMVNQPERLPERYGGSVERAVAAISRFAVEWEEETLPALDHTPTTLPTEVQALRVGDVYFVATEAELFTTLDLAVRAGWAAEDLFVLGFSNGTIGYLPDAAEIERGGYAAVQSPKGMGQFPFTAESGSVFVNGALEVLRTCRVAGRQSSGPRLRESPS